MEISEKLSTYIEQQFQEMEAGSSKQETEPGQDVFDWLFSIERKKTSPTTKRKQRQRKKDKDLRILKARKDITGEDYIKAHAAILIEYERDPKQRGTSTQKRYKTKATTELNVFLYKCYYLIGKENPEAKDVKLYEWIEIYLEDKDYRMKDKKSPYDTEAIKTRMQYYKNEDPVIISAINSLIDDDYARLT